jgi:hypothetical protein
MTVEARLAVIAGEIFTERREKFWRLPPARFIGLGRATIQRIAKPKWARYKRMTATTFRLIVSH